MLVLTTHYISTNLDTFSYLREHLDDEFFILLGHLRVATNGGSALSRESMIIKLHIKAKNKVRKQEYYAM